MNINEKMFTYISYSGNLTVDMINKYKNSLIFIGDEQQIYQPLTNTYVGVGMSYINELSDKISNNTTKITSYISYYNNYLQAAYITNIYAQYSPDDFTGMTTTNYGNLWGAGNNVNTDMISKLSPRFVIKGKYDYDPDEPYGTSYKDKNLTDKTWTKGASYGTSGINVSVEREIKINEGIDTETGLAYTYWEPIQTLLIDDTLTWSYITHNTEMLQDFARMIAKREANNIYHTILGSGEDAVPTSVHNIIDDIKDNGELNTNYYVKLNNKYSDEASSSQYTQVSYVKSSGYLNITIKDKSNPSSEITTTIGYFSNNQITSYDSASTYLAQYDGINSADQIIWYIVDDSNSSYNYDITDGIQTLKEVAYILDVITDGSHDGGDGGISLAYDIADNHNKIASIITDLNTYITPNDSPFVTNISITNTSDSANNASVSPIILTYTSENTNSSGKGNVTITATTFLTSGDTNENDVWVTANVNNLATGSFVNAYMTYTFDVLSSMIDDVETAASGGLSALNGSYIFTPTGGVDGNAYTTYHITKITQEKGFVYVTSEAIPKDEILTAPLFTTGYIYKRINPAIIGASQTWADNTFTITNGNFTSYTGPGGDIDAIPAKYYETHLFEQVSTDTLFEQVISENDNKVTFSDLIKNITTNGANYFVKDGNSFVPLDVNLYLSNHNNISYLTEVANSHNIYSIISGDSNSLRSSGNKYLESSTKIDAYGVTYTFIAPYITYLQAATENYTGFADAYDVRNTVERMFTWIDLSTDEKYKATGS